MKPKEFIITLAILLFSLSVYGQDVVWSYDYTSLWSYGCYHHTNEFDDYYDWFCRTHTNNNTRYDKAYLSYYGEEVCKISRIKNDKVETDLTLSVNKKGKWGYKNKKGKYVIRPIFEEAKEFVSIPGIKRQIAVVKYLGKWGLITNSGEFIALGLQEIIEFSNAGRAIVKIKDKYNVLAIREDSFSLCWGDTIVEEQKYYVGYIYSPIDDCGFKPLDADEVVTLKNNYAFRTKDKAGKDCWWLLSSDLTTIYRFGCSIIKDFGDNALVIQHRGSNYYDLIRNTDWSYLISSGFEEIEYVDSLFYSVKLFSGGGYQAYSLNGELLLDNLKAHPINSYYLVTDKDNTLDSEFSDSIHSIQLISTDDNGKKYLVKTKYPYIAYTSKLLPNSKEHIIRIELPYGITRIEESVFSSCPNLKSVTLPDGIEELPNYAFANCNKLSDIDIPGTVKKIGPHCFENCESLSSLLLPAGIRFGEYSFMNCKSLSSVRYFDGDYKIDYKDWSLPEGVFCGCNNLEYYGRQIGDLGRRAFYGCEKLKKVDLELTRIMSDECFGKCKELIIETQPKYLEQFALSSFIDTNNGEIRTFWFLINYLYPLYSPIIKEKSDYCTFLDFIIEEVDEQSNMLARTIVLNETTGYCEDEHGFDCEMKGNRIILTERRGKEFKIVVTPFLYEGELRLKVNNDIWAPVEKSLASDVWAYYNNYQRNKVYNQFHNPNGAIEAAELIRRHNEAVWARIIGEQDAAKIVYDEWLRQHKY